MEVCSPTSSSQPRNWWPQTDKIRNPTLSRMADFFCVCFVFFGDLLRCLCSFLDSISCIHSSGNRIFPLAKAPTWRVSMTCRLRRDVNNPVEPRELESFFALRRLDRLKTTQHKTVELWNPVQLQTSRNFYLIIIFFILFCRTLVWDWHPLSETVLDYFCFVVA